MPLSYRLYSNGLRLTPIFILGSSAGISADNNADNKCVIMWFTPSYWLLYLAPALRINATSFSLEYLPYLNFILKVRYLGHHYSSVALHPCKIERTNLTTKYLILQDIIGLCIKWSLLDESFEVCKKFDDSDRRSQIDFQGSNPPVPT